MRECAATHSSTMTNTALATSPDAADARQAIRRALRACAERRGASASLTQPEYVRLRLASEPTIRAVWRAYGCWRAALLDSGTGLAPARHRRVRAGAACRRALSAVAARLDGRAPTMREYDELKATGTPCSSAIRRAYDSWPGALADAQLSASPRQVARSRTCARHAA